MNDAALYTGVDGDINTGIFGNETANEETTKVVENQRRLLAELTPQLQGIVDMIDGEIKITTEFICGYLDNTKDDDTLMRGELKAAARYKKYLGELKTKFALALNETKK